MLHFYSGKPLHIHSGVDNAHVERPWQRAGFRHPDLNIWVRANRARLVAACLTLCQAWIAAGCPRGQRSIGSYENWAGVIGGILETAGIDGFLGNIEEMMAASDTEGGAWHVFVSGWWARYGTAEVKAADLYEIALACEPPLPLGGANEHARRIRFGKALGKMRDRVFRVDGRELTLTGLGLSHQAQLWQLKIGGECGECFPRENPVDAGECLATPGSVDEQHSPEQPLENNRSGECGECGECFSTLTHARARTTDNKSTEKHSPHSPHSPEQAKSTACTGEGSGECLEPHSPKPAGRLRAPWELVPEPPAPPPDKTWKKQPRSPLFKDGQPIPDWLAEVMK